MIAANYRKHPEAMALQMVLPFGRALVWALDRPTTRALRAIRAARAAAFKAAGRIAYPIKPSMPDWIRTANKKARELAQAVKAACIRLDFSAPVAEAQNQPMNAYRRNVLKMRAHFAVR